MSEDQSDNTTHHYDIAHAQEVIEQIIKDGGLSVVRNEGHLEWIVASDVAAARLSDELGIDVEKMTAVQQMGLTLPARNFKGYENLVKIMGFGTSYKNKDNLLQATGGEELGGPEFLNRVLAGVASLPLAGQKMAK
jgi:hypothetical protein